MTKWQDNCFKVEIVAFIISIIVSVVYLTLRIQGIESRVLLVCIYLGAVVTCISAFLMFVVEPIKFVINVYKNFRTFDDKNSDFNIIDEGNTYYYENNELYQRRIARINYFYSKSPQFKKIKTDKKLDILYKRYSYLSKQDSFRKDVLSNMVAVILSIIAALTMSYFNAETVGIVQIGMIIGIVILFFFSVTARFVHQGVWGSYLYMINKYELQLLEREILEIEKTVIVDEENYKLLHTQQMLLDKLIHIRKKERRKDEKRKIEEDIAIIEKLELYNYRKIDDSCYMKKIETDSEVVYLPYCHRQNSGDILVEDEDIKVLNSMLRKYHVTT